MCYYDHTLWPCGYWRWGPFRMQCEREHRTGETCGLKLVWQTFLQPGNCKTCENIGKKDRKIAKLLDDIRRWRGEGHRRASIARAEQEIAELAAQISTLRAEHEQRSRSLAY